MGVGDRPSLAWCDAEKLVVARDEVHGTSEPELRDEAVEGAPGALYVRLHDEADVQLLQRPAQLGGVASTPKLFVEALGLFGGTLKDAMPVAVLRGAR